MQALRDIFDEKKGVVVSAIALKMGELEDTVHKWRARGRVPENKLLTFVDAVNSVGGDVDVMDVLRINAPMGKRGWPAGKPRTKKKKARR